MVSPRYKPVKVPVAWLRPGDKIYQGADRASRVKAITVRRSSRIVVELEDDTRSVYDLAGFYEYAEQIA